MSGHAERWANVKNSTLVARLGLISAIVVLLSWRDRKAGAAGFDTEKYAAAWSAIASEHTQVVDRSPGIFAIVDELGRNDMVDALHATVRGRLSARTAESSTPWWANAGAPAYPR